MSNCAAGHRRQKNQLTMKKLFLILLPLLAIAGKAWGAYVKVGGYELQPGTTHNHSNNSRIDSGTASLSSDAKTLTLTDMAFSTGKATGIENIVTKNQTGAVIPDECFANDESLSQSIWRWLFSILEVNTIITTIAQQTLESRQVVRRGDDKDVSDASEHQHRDWVVNHRFVKDWD